MTRLAYDHRCKCLRCYESRDRVARWLWWGLILGLIGAAFFGL